VEAHEYNIRFFLVLYMCDVLENAEQLNFIAKLVTKKCVCIYVVRILSAVQLFLIF